MTTPQLLVTGATQATVEITQADQAFVEVTAPTVPLVVEIQVLGPQGPATPPRSVRIDADTAGVIYEGTAQNGASESAAVWSITKATYNLAGLRQTQGTATDVTWTGRTGHTYS